MRKNWKLLAIGAVITLLSINIVLFSKTIIIGDNVSKTENEIHKLKITNMELEQKLYTMNSLERLSMVAKELGFTKEAQPITLNNLTYAQAK
jgi:cell division protein FtsL